MIAKIARAAVHLHHIHVGELTYSQGGSHFRYDDDVASPDHSVLGQIFEDEPGTIREARVGLPPWFANLLPEGAMRRYVERSLSAGRIGDFTLLCRLGRDLPGAVTVHAETEPLDEPITELAVPDHRLWPSLAGVQLKFSVQSERVRFPVSGEGGWWIAKLSDPSLPELPTNEYLTMRWLEAAGIRVPQTRLILAADIPELPSGVAKPDEPVYVVERFDRTADGRIHVEDFAQVADVEPMFKYRHAGVTYDGIAAVLLRISGVPAYEEYIRRLVAMVITGNTDAHLKNWAVMYPDGRTAQISPAFDFHSLSVYQAYRYTPMALILGGEEVAAAVTLDNFRRLAEAAATDVDHTVDLVGESIEAMRVSWAAGIQQKTAKRFPALAEHYEKRLTSLALTRS